MSPKAMLLPVAMFTNLNSQPYLQGIAWLVAKCSKLLEPTSSLKKLSCLDILTDNYFKGLSHASFGKFHIDQQISSCKYKPSVENVSGSTYTNVLFIIPLSWLCYSLLQIFQTQIFIIHF